ncbi:MAG TPA: FimV/HubP family polar landmark protein [Ramlibacter sp.]
MKRKRLPSEQAVGTQSSVRGPHWRATTLAFAASMLLATWAGDANALALGRVTVRSAIGEPLRAEIDIPEITPEEVASLKVNLAAPETFRAQGLDYNPALADARVTLEKRSDGSYILRVVSPHAIDDPFIDLLLETSWSSGRLTREYTMLFDPPAMRTQQPPLQAQAPAPAQASPAPRAKSTAPTPLPPATPVARARGGARTPTAAPAPAAAPSGEGKQVTVKAGDTAGKIAGANKPEAVSLDQMLVAMLRSNPDAFIGGNVNRIRAGAVLQVPSEQEAALIPPDDAHETLVAQSRDFNEFRRRVAENVPQAQATPAERQSSGKITAKVEEKKPTANAPDKLTLSKGSATGKTGTEDKIAKERATQDSAQRVAELSKNIAELNKLGTPAKSAGTAAPAASAGKPGIPVPLGTPGAMAAKPAPAPAAATPAPAPTPAPAVAAKPAPAATPAATTAASAIAPAAAPAVASASAMTAPASAAKPAPAVASVAAAAKPPAKPAVATPPQPSFIDQLLDNPLLVAGAGLIVLLAAGFGFYRLQQRKKSAQVDSSFLESRLQPDSFFGASGGQRIDTNEGGVTGSSMVYSPSQLDAAGDVDPVAEADVYLAYGRDLQAEEILKEALRTQPQRVAIHTKLLEIYAKRRDAKAFELIATEAYGLSHGEGPDWEKICELGQELDPTNSLYRPGGQPSDGAVAAAAAVGSPAAPAAFGEAMQTQAIAAEAAAQPDIDLDLDFSLDDAAPDVSAPVATAERTQAMAAPAAAPQTFDRTQAVEAAADMPALDLDFGAEPAAAARAPAPAAAATLDAPDLVLDEHSLNFDATPVPPAPAPVAAAPAAPDDGMLEFDLGSLSLDLPGTKKDAAAPAPAPAAAAGKANGPDSEGPTTAGSPLSTEGFDDTGGDPLATKLALAQEFNAIGDPDGARTLAQEVIAEASGELKSAAQKFLAEIS